MLQRRGFRFRLKPTKRDAELLNLSVDSSRFVWNELLLQNQLRLERGESRLSYPTMCSYLVFLKREHPFLREAYSQTLQQTLKDLDVAYNRAFDCSLDARFPRLKKRQRPIGIRFPQGFKIDGRAVFLPKIGWIGFRKSREIEGVPKGIVVRSDGHNWFITIIAEREMEVPLRTDATAVGIDLGIVRFAALSDGTFVESIHASKKNEKRVSRLLRQMSRKRKFSANWQRTKSRLSQLIVRITNTRNDMLHKASTEICENHASVVMEDLRISNMSASAKGTVDFPGTNVRSKAALNRRILDQGWGEFRRQILCKMLWSGGAVRFVDPSNTSRVCSECGFASLKNRQGQALFKCLGCGFMTNADTNAAVNILRRAGRARIACGDRPEGRSVKQEALFAALRQTEESLPMRGARQKEDVGGSDFVAPLGSQPGNADFTFALKGARFR